MFELNADIIEYQNNIIQAVGKIDVFYKKCLLNTQSILYKKPYLFSFHPTLIQDEQKNKIFTEKVIIDTKNNLIYTKKIRIRLNNLSSLSGATCVKDNQNNFVIKNAKFTTCYSCKKKPTWYIKAKKVTYNSKEIIYTHAFFYIQDIPVFYLPYFFHPNPKIKYKAGILVPILSYAKKLGFYTKIPVYYPFNERSDIEFTPILSQKKNIWIGGVRYFAAKNTFCLKTSYTYFKKKKWHINLKNQYYFSQKTRISIAIHRTNDLDYLIDYPIEKNITGFLHNNKKNLKSYGFLEHFNNKHYLLTGGYFFQTDSFKKKQIIAPHFYYNYFTHHNNFEYNFELEFESIKHNPYKKYNNFLQNILDIGYKKNINGFIFEQHFSNKTNLFHMNSKKKEKKKWRKYFFPLSQTTISYPVLISANQSIEPILQFNSQFKDNLLLKKKYSVLQLDRNNLFSIYREHNLDTNEISSRIVSGLKYDMVHSQLYTTGIFLGMSHEKSFKNPQYISEIKTGSNKLSFIHKNLFSQKKLYISETGIAFGKKYKVNTAHIYAREKDKKNHQLQWQITFPIRKYIECSYAQVYQLGYKISKKEKRNLNQFLVLKYQDECARLEIGFFIDGYNQKRKARNYGAICTFSLNKLGNLDLAKSSYTLPSFVRSPC